MRRNNAIYIREDGRKMKNCWLVMMKVKKRDAVLKFQKDGVAVKRESSNSKHFKFLRVQLKLDG
jgi:hypothetical protein